MHGPSGVARLPAYGRIRLTFPPSVNTLNEQVL
jgi:hypothetical protein